ncbi:MAG: hypothetical protein RBT62_10400 [Spirochaetia bacterium]|jgi:hypothetical protein|nr:hypothetical protein [Spirochaetia bacterium]
MIGGRGALALASWLLLLMVDTAWSQGVTTESPEPLPELRIMVGVSGSGNAADVQSLAVALSESPRLGVVFIATSGNTTVAEAARARCPLAIVVTSQKLDSGDARSTWSMVDSLSGDILAEGAIEGPEPTAWDLAEFWWLPIVGAAETALPTAATSFIRVVAAPETRIHGLGEQEILLPDSGVVELELRLPGVYDWRAVLHGSYPESGSFAAMRQGDTLSIQQQPLLTWSAELGAYMAQFPDIWASWRFADDWLFLRAGLSQFLLGLYLVDYEYDTEKTPAILSLRLIQPGIGFGGYMLPSDASIRPYATLAAGLRLSAPGTERWALDAIAPLCFSAALGAEWRFTFRAAIFLELGATIYPFTDGALMAASKGNDKTGAWMSDYGEQWFLDIPAIRLGIRVFI